METEIKKGNIVERSVATADSSEILAGKQKVFALIFLMPV